MNDKQFDLEQGILNCWNICEDMKIIAENVLEAKTVDRDKVANMLLGMAELYQLKFEKTFSDFEETSKYYYDQRKKLQEVIGNIEDRHVF
jgi:HD-like signal output (HDOD) protein